MAAVAVRRIGGMLAQTQEGIAAFAGDELLRGEARALVTTVAEGLIFGQATGAVKILLTFFEWDLLRPVVGNSRVIHHYRH